MKDMRSLKMLVAETDDIGGPEVRRYIERGYGLIQIPDLTALSRPSRNGFLSVVADEIEEFLENGETVVMLKGKNDRWTRTLIGMLARRRVSPEIRESQSV